MSVPGRENQPEDGAVSGRAEDRAVAERARLYEAMAVTSAESVVTGARIAELVEAQRAARARWAAAKASYVS